MNSGIIPINKPEGWTSFDIVNKLKHMVKPLRVGHLGTLDPMATGVLLVTVGRATKLFDIMQEKLKVYVAEFELGKLTDTLDATGETLEEISNFIVSEEQLQVAISKQIGEILQVPPKFSAKSINGKRAYELARNNVEFEIPAKRVKIFDIKLIQFDGIKFKLEINCGSGTYIRSIGRDIGEIIGVPATMTALERINVGIYSINNCYEIQSINKENVFDKIVSVNEILDYKNINLTEEQIFKVLNGQKLNVDVDDGIYKLNKENNTIALIKVVNNIAKMSLFLGE